MNSLDENAWLNTAIEKLKETTGYDIELLNNVNRIDNIIDGKLLIKTPKNIYIYPYMGKKWMNNAVIGLMCHELGNNYPNVILITNYVNKLAAEKLKEIDIQFIDMAGNAYMKCDELFIYINGRRNETEIKNKQETVRLYTTTGLKLIFTILCVDNAINKPYRQIAELAGVANGTVGWIINDLIKLGYLIKKDKKRYLLNKEELIKKWVEYYPFKLKNKLKKQKYRTQKNDWQNYININFEGIYLGGEIAAAKITNYLQPKYLTLYAEGNINKLLIEKKMIQDAKGEIEIIHKFWNFKDANDQEGIVPDLLIYADLLATENGRNIESAGMIYEQRIKRHLQ